MPVIKFDFTQADRLREAKIEKAKARLKPTAEITEDNQPGVPRFKTYTTTELLELPRTFEWLAKGLIVTPTFGPIGGAKKTLKSYVKTFIDVGVAAGIPIFGQFEVPLAKAVVSYVGEGGRIPHTNRLERIARSMGVNLKDIPLITSFEAAPVASAKFQHSLLSDLRDHRPGLVSIDPMYAYQGGQVNSSDLYQRGEMLHQMSRPVVEAEAVLNLVDHWNKTGSGTGIDRMTQAGMGEWADTWLMLNHRELPDVENGSFKLFLEVGSREWGGSNWELDIALGRFDEETGQHLGDISWEIRRTSAEAVAGGTKKQSHDDTDYQDEINQLLGEKPWQLTKTEVLERVGDNKKARVAFSLLMTAGLVIARPLKRPEGGIQKQRDLWALHSEPRPTTGVED